MLEWKEPNIIVLLNCAFPIVCINIPSFLVELIKVVHSAGMRQE